MKKQKEFFEKLAQEWDREHQTEEEVDRTIRFARRYLPVSAGERILDIGCGTSRLVPHIIENIGDNGVLIEMDFSIEMLKIGRDRYRIPNVFFVQGDGHVLPLKQYSLDKVICMAFFPHLLDKQSAVKGFASVLKSGGRLLIAHQMMREELNHFHGRVNGPVNNDLLPDEGNMKSMLETGGFREIEFKEEPGLYLVTAVRE